MSAKERTAPIYYRRSPTPLGFLSRRQTALCFADPRACTWIPEGAGYRQNRGSAPLLRSHLHTKSRKAKTTDSRLMVNLSRFLASKSNCKPFDTEVTKRKIFLHSEPPKR